MRPTKFNHFQKTFKNIFTKISSDLFFSLLIFAIMLTILTNPSYFSNGTLEGINLFVFNVMPGLFPFMFLTKMLTEIGFIFKITSKCDKFSKKVFGTSGLSIYALIMSILSGYPIGAKIISDLYEKRLIDENEAKKMSVFCTTSGPIFIIGAVGTGMFKSLKIGLILYFSHIISSIFMGIFYNILTKKKNETKSQNCPILLSKSNNIFSKCISETINSIFTVGAYITIFYLISEMCDYFELTSKISNGIYFALKNLGFSKNDCTGLVYGFLEVTRGAKTIASTSKLSIALCSGILSFSGISIIMQSMSFLKITKIKTHSFLLIKMVHFCLSFLLCMFALIIFF